MLGHGVVDPVAARLKAEEQARREAELRQAEQRQQIADAEERMRKEANEAGTLIGSSIQPSEIPLTGEKIITLGELVVAAHQASGLSREEWNELQGEEREAMIATAKERLTAQAEAEAAARLLAEQEEATRQAAIRREAEQREAAARQAAEASAAAAAAARPVARSLRSISTPAPRFPPDALRSGTSGEVLVEFTVGTDGSVTDARVLRAEPARTFDREAVNAVRRWRFEPVDAPVTTRRTLVFNPGG